MVIFTTMMRTRNRTAARKRVIGIFVLDIINDIDVKLSRNIWFVDICVGEISVRYVRDMSISLRVGRK